MNHGTPGCNVGQPQLVYSTQGYATSFPSSRLILNQADPSSNAINSQQSWQQVILSPDPSQQQPQQIQYHHLQHGLPVQLQIQSDIQQTSSLHNQHPQQFQVQPNQHIVIQPRHSRAGETLILPQGTFISDSNPLTTSETQFQTIEIQPAITVAYPSNQVATTNMGEVSGSSKDSGIQQLKLPITQKVATTSPGDAQRLDKISVPWPWSRIKNLEGHVIYLSPGGNELRSLDDVKSYLLKAGACKCGLICPLHVEQVFNFDPQVKSEPSSVNLGPPNPSRFCFHQTRTASMYKWETLSFTNKVIHVRFHPSIKNYRKPNRKKRPLSGVLTQAMIEAREFEKKRIHEIIFHQKRKFELAKSFTATADSAKPHVDEDKAKGDILVQKNSCNTQAMSSGDTCASRPSQKETSTLAKSSSPSPLPAIPTTSANTNMLKTEKRRPSSDVITQMILEVTEDGKKRASEERNIKSFTSTPDTLTTNLGDEKDIEEAQGETNKSPTQLLPSGIIPASRPSQKETSTLAKSPAPSLSPSISKSISKNNAILQMSGTNEGNQILSDAWGSPEKDQMGSSPLEMVEGIVASLQPMADLPPAQPLPKKPRKRVEPPAWVTTPRRPLMSSQILRPNYNMPSQARPQFLPVSSGIVNMNPTMMQLVNTTSGPMLVSEGAQLHHVDDTNFQQQQHIFIHQGPSLLPTSPMVLSNGVMTIPTQTGIIYNPVANGSLLQVQNGQTLMTSQLPLFMNPVQPTNSNSQMLPSNISPGGTLLLSRSGGVIQLQPGGSIQPSNSSILTLELVGNPSDDDESTGQDPKRKSAKQSKAKIGTSSVIQSNHVDSSGLEATPPHAWEESETNSKAKATPQTESGSSSLENKQETFVPGELVWGPLRTFPSWPGKIVSVEDDLESKDNVKTKVYWFGTREVSGVKMSDLKSLSEGLEEHHKERQKLRRGRRMSSGLELAIQEAMSELDCLQAN